MWNTKGVPLKIVLLVMGMMFLVSQMDSLQFWRRVHDATTPGKEHAGLTREEAVAAAVAKVEGYFDRHGYAGGHLSLVRAAPIDGQVQWWCKGCKHWQVELRRREERFCLAVTEDFSAFSSGCSRWHTRAVRPPATLVMAARPGRVQGPAGRGGLVLQRRIGRTADLYVLDVATGRLRHVPDRAPRKQSRLVARPPAACIHREPRRLGAGRVHDACRRDGRHSRDELCRA